MDESAIADYLREHPDFLTRHPELVDSLSVPHPAGEAASLIEYQVSVLRDKNRELTGKLRDYHQRAEENETLLRRVYDFCLEIVASGSVDELQETLRERLRKSFGCDHVQLALFAPHQVGGVATLEGEDVEVFEAFRRDHGTVCGRISRQRLGRLFDDEAVAAIESGALITVGNPGYGVLALGSGDEHKFYPGMGTLFLELLGQVLGQRLRVLARPSHKAPGDGESGDEASSE